MRVWLSPWDLDLIVNGSVDDNNVPHIDNVFFTVPEDGPAQNPGNVNPSSANVNPSPANVIDVEFEEVQDKATTIHEEIAALNPDADSTSIREKIGESAKLYGDSEGREDSGRTTWLDYLEADDHKFTDGHYAEMIQSNEPGFCGKTVGENIQDAVAEEGPIGEWRAGISAEQNRKGHTTRRV